MSAPRKFSTKAFAQTNTTFRAYVRDDSTGAAMLPAALTAISYAVTQTVGPSVGTSTGSGSLSPVATYLSGTLSTVGWDIDSIGYNFKATLPASCFPDAGNYNVVFLGTLADGTTFIIAHCDHHAFSRS